MQTETHPKPLASCNAFQRDALHAIDVLVDPNGKDINRHLSGVYPDGLTDHRVYSNLNGLVESGLVEKTQPDDRQNAYHLTDRGRRALAADREWRCNNE